MELIASEREQLDPGFRRAYQPPAKTDAPPIVPTGGGRLAKLAKGERVKPQRVRTVKHVQERAVMSEAELIQAMQTHGIGRPSTYAATVETLVARGYATRGKAGALTPTDRGRAVCKFLVNRFPGLFDTAYTARMETALDAIARGQATCLDLVGPFWQELRALLDKKKVG